MFIAELEEERTIRKPRLLLVLLALFQFLLPTSQLLALLFQLPPQL